MLVEPLNSGHLRVRVLLSAIRRCPLYRGNTLIAIYIMVPATLYLMVLYIIFLMISLQSVHSSFTRTWRIGAEAGLYFSVVSTKLIQLSYFDRRTSAFFVDITVEPLISGHARDHGLLSAIRRCPL